MTDLREKIARELAKESCAGVGIDFSKVGDVPLDPWLDSADAVIEVLREQEPVAFLYEYVSPMDGKTPVWRTVHGEWNGQQAKSSRPLYAAPVPPAGQEGSRHEVEDLLGAYWDCAYQEGHLQRPDGDKANDILHRLRQLLTIPPAKPLEWPMLSTSHLQGICFAYEKGFAAGYDDRNTENVFVETGSQAAAFDVGLSSGRQNRKTCPPAKPVVPEGWSFHPQDDGTMFLVTPHGNGLVARTDDNPVSAVLHALASALIEAQNLRREVDQLHAEIEQLRRGKS
jgi:hypothetical protein